MIECILGTGGGVRCEGVNLKTPRYSVASEAGSRVWIACAGEVDEISVIEFGGRGG